MRVLRLFSLLVVVLTATAAADARACTPQALTEDAVSVDLVESIDTTGTPTGTVAPTEIAATVEPAPTIGIATETGSPSVGWRSETRLFMQPDERTDCESIPPGQGEGNGTQDYGGALPGGSDGTDSGDDAALHVTTLPSTGAAPASPPTTWLLLAVSAALVLAAAGFAARRTLR
jgi:hypothetical protein